MTDAEAYAEKTRYWEERIKEAEERGAREMAELVATEIHAKNTSLWGTFIKNHMERWRGQNDRRT